MDIKKVAIYTRVSTLEQAESGYSIGEQLDKLTKYAEIHDWVIYDTYSDPGFTGSNTHRPGLDSLCRDAKSKKFDIILVYKLDRLSRSQKDTLYLIEEVFTPSGVDFVSINENFDTSSAFGKASIYTTNRFGMDRRKYRVARQTSPYDRTSRRTISNFSYNDKIRHVSKR